MRELTLQDVPLALEHFARQAGHNRTAAAALAEMEKKESPEDKLKVLRKLVETAYRYTDMVNMTVQYLDTQQRRATYKTARRKIKKARVLL